MSILNKINSEFSDYQELISFYEESKDKMFSNIHLEIRNFFSANMSAVLGAILDIFTSNLNNVHFDYLDPMIKTVLLKNDFLTYYGEQRALDTNNTTIRYQKLSPTDGKYFKTYVIEELIDGHSKDLPKMTDGVKDKILEAIYEIFVNAQIHSETKFIYTCGQFFPKKNEIHFTFVDVGIGFKEKVNRSFSSNLSSIQAIGWAIKDKHTTKKGVSGGIGLAILKDFIVANRGKMQIISNDGFYELDATHEDLKQFRGEFPGTIVNLQFKTDDRNNYSLKSEIDINDIF